MIRGPLRLRAVQTAPRRCDGRRSGVGPAPAQMWKVRAQSRRRCGRDEPSPSADVGKEGPGGTIEHNRYVGGRAGHDSLASHYRNHVPARVRVCMYV